MAKGPTYRVKLRRRREGKTNYYKRRELLKSGETRAIIRRSTKNIRVQLVESLSNGDKTLVASSSLELSEYGWKLSGGNIPASYLTGYLAGKRAIKAGNKTAILDLGLQRSTTGSRIYAALKGMIDAGVDISANEKIFPTEDVLQGAHIATIAKAVKAVNDDFKSVFSKYTKGKITPAKITDHFNSVKAAIEEKN
ncbi:MAG: 50S ribosomal protein L18 [Candidatus Heimdallarchaeota archaeon]|nr:50S ribosomal protein L18 [Candidatus Heimdallarchaeota archaeon]